MDDLRVVVAGHVDHGKSTIIGRLLYDTGSLALPVAHKLDETGEFQDATLAFITDQLSEEQEGSFTLDTTHAYFRTTQRDYTLIDTPGHREFLKNMVTGATKADAAVLVVDVAEGPLLQTYLHAYLIAMLGIRQVIIAVNKMDLISYDCHRFRNLSQQLAHHCERIGIIPVAVIPVSAQQGDQIVRPSDRMPWNLAPTLVEALEELIVPEKNEHQPLRFLVQCVFPTRGRRAILGRVISGCLRQGQVLAFGPGSHETLVASLLLGEQGVHVAGAGQCVGLFLQDPAPVSRGCIGFAGSNVPAITDHFTARVFWIDRRPLEPNGRIELLCGTQSHHGCAERIAKVIDPISLAVETKAVRLDDSQVGEITIRTDSPVCVDPFNAVPELGRFAIVQDGRVAGGGVTLG